MKLDIGADEAVKAIIRMMEERKIIDENYRSDMSVKTPDWKAKTDCIPEAKILISGGRGIGSPEFFDELHKVAVLVGGEVSSSRVNVVAGWIDRSRQVGNTGNIVNPKLYMACGISGTNQHKAGMSGSECIIAINKNPGAPMFDIADLGIVGDVKVIIPELIDALKKRQKTD